jgi:hypothetical protein
LGVLLPEPLRESSERKNEYVNPDPTIVPATKGVCQRAAQTVSDNLEMVGQMTTLAAAFGVEMSRQSASTFPAESLALPAGCPERLKNNRSKGKIYASRAARNLTKLAQRLSD